MEPNICFIIGQKYFRHIRSFLFYYLDNIQRFYPKNSFVLIVDNQSEHMNDLIPLLSEYSNVKWISNTNESKYDIGAYTFGIEYLIRENLVSNFEYFIFSHDNFVIKNKFPFETLKEKQVVACSINHYPYDPNDIHGKEEMIRFGIYDQLNCFSLCIFNSFVIHQDKLVYLYHKYLKHVILKTRNDSQNAERYLGRILYELNNHQNVYLDQYMDSYDGDYLWIGADRIEVSSYFKKCLSNRPDG